MAILGLTKRYSPLDRIILALLPESVRKEQRAHGALLKAKVEKRLESQDPRPDFVSFSKVQGNDVFLLIRVNSYLKRKSCLIPLLEW